MVYVCLIHSLVGHLKFYIFSIHCFFAEGKKAKRWLGMMKSGILNSGVGGFRIATFRDSVHHV